MNLRTPQDGVATTEQVGTCETGQISLLQWLRYGPFLAQVVIVRRCNLSCGYCFEFDKTSEPVPYATLQMRLEKLRQLRAWTVCLTGGEPTLYPDLVKLVRSLRELGFRRRQMITNGYRLTKELIEGLNSAGLTDLQISVDGVRPNAMTKKVLGALRKQLEILSRRARFRVVLSAVIGASPPEEAIEVVEFAKNHGLAPRILLIHDESGQRKLTPEELAGYYEVKRRIGRAAREAGDYRRKLIQQGAAPFRCRAGARYLYVDEFGKAHWCSQTREIFAKDLLEYTFDDLRKQFHTEKSCSAKCTIGCARTASAYDEWRPQGS
jgi:Predicted Fe-S oxidoreductases